MILKSFRNPRSCDPWPEGRRPALACFLLLALLTLSSCSVALMEDIRVSSYMQKKQHHEVIRALQPRTAAPGEISSFQLYLLAGAYYEVRDYEKMLSTTDLLQKAIDRGDKSYVGSDLTPFPQILRSLVHLDQGNYGKAIQEAEEAYALLNRPEAKSNNFYRSQMIDISAALGIAHANLNHPTEVDRSLAVLQGINIQMSILGPEKFLAIAKVNMAMKRFDRALQAVKDPAAKVSGLVTVFYDQTFQELPKFYILTKCLLETGAVKEAKNGYDQLLKHPQISQIGGIHWPVLLDRAKIAREEGDRALAERLLKEAAELIEKQRSSINTEAGRIGYVGDKQAIYHGLISLLVEDGRAAEAFEYAERAKGRALVDLLASQKNISIRGSRGVDEPLSQLAKAESSLNVVADPAVAGSPGTRGVVVKLKADLSARDPELSSLVTVSGATLPEIQKHLAGDETLLEYYAAGRDWFLFILTREGITAKKLESAEVEKDVEKFREALVNPDSRGHVVLSQTLHRQLVGPVSGLLTTKRLTIVPHGALHYLPFAALYGGGAYLIDRYDLRVLPNASVLKFLKGSPKEGERKSLIMGNPDLGDPRYSLNYAQEESLSISRILPGALLLLGTEARASYVQRNGGQYQFIHFAAHGLFDPDNPLNSALLLAKDQGHDGRLRAGDLYSLNLNADLVTLSACETALSKVSKGDDVVGFTRGFLYAGSRAIVSSLWKVDDLATRDLMVDFYANLSRMPKDEALRLAQFKVRERYPHPFYWAAFQLTGLTQ